MKFFRFRYDIFRYSIFAPVSGYDQNLADSIKLITKDLIRPIWVPRYYNRVEPDRPIPDFVDCGHFLGFTDRVLEIPEMKAWLENAGELLPIYLNGFGQGSILHCLKFIDAVSFTYSKGRKGTRGWHFDKLVLRPICLSASCIFMPTESVMLLLADTMDGTSASFRHVYEREGLTGLEFIEVPVMGE